MTAGGAGQRLQCRSLAALHRRSSASLAPFLRCVSPYKSGAASGSRHQSATDRRTMKTAALLCLLALSGASASRVRRDAKASFDERASANEVEKAHWRASPEPSPLAGLSQYLPLLQSVWSLGSQLISSLGADGAGEEVARALSHTDPMELALNTIDLDTPPCRQRLACEIRSTIGEYAFGNMAYELLASRMPSLKKYERLSARQLGVTSCSEAFTCRYSDSPYMDTARQMRSMAGSYCSTDAESLTGRICQAFAFIMDTLETL